ncbi:MAG: 1-acyl-sn-glycerol-3-phosphate acyltransferase [Erysipelotrichaceae bacterium]|nr:1-acyl-sn-glycerol-3-phosphate acyltransferase [Erysipelotrichaceae bacterium]
MKNINGFDPKTNKFPYPINTDEHYLVVKKDNGLVFDENYPYIDKSFWFNFMRRVIYAIIFCIVFPLTHIRLGLKIYGKKNLKENKALIKKGAISVANHVHMWDYLSLMNALKPRRPYLFVWDKNIRGEMSFVIRMVGGVPIPENNINATRQFNKSIEEALNDGHIVHIYAEGSMWEYYRPIRPFKTSMAYYAIKCDKPIIPMAFSYRKPGWIRRNIFHQIALFNLNIGKPILPERMSQEELTRKVHEEICRLAGIQNNLYNAIYHNDKRIDYYTSEYGIGYKGSK